MVVTVQTIAEHLCKSSVVRGRLVSIETDGTLVVRADNTESESFQCDCLNPSALTEQYNPGDEVLFMLPTSPETRGCVLGVVGRYKPDDKSPELTPKRTIRQEQIEIIGDKSLVLRCGEASLTLTDDGSIVIRARRMLQRSKGTIKIKGAAVQVN